MHGSFHNTYHSDDLLMICTIYSLSYIYMYTVYCFHEYTSSRDHYLLDRDPFFVDDRQKQCRAFDNNAQSILRFSTLSTLSLGDLQLNQLHRCLCQTYPRCGKNNPLTTCILNGGGISLRQSIATLLNVNITTFDDEWRIRRRVYSYFNCPLYCVWNVIWLSRRIWGFNYAESFCQE